jgi:class 3 adenylate cyclase
MSIGFGFDFARPSGWSPRHASSRTAARVMSLAASDEVLVSSTTRDLLEGSDLGLEDAGTHELKGLSGPRQVFRLAALGSG